MRHRAESSVNADSADSADSADNADNADNADSADNADNARLTDPAFAGSVSSQPRRPAFLRGNNHYEWLVRIVVTITSWPMV